MTLHRVTTFQQKCQSGFKILFPESCNLATWFHFQFHIILSQGREANRLFAEEKLSTFRNKLSPSRKQACVRQVELSFLHLPMNLHY